MATRLAVALRRRAAPKSFVLGELAIRYEDRRVMVGGRAVRLTATEYALLRVLSLNAGRVVSYESLFRQVWDGRADVHALRTFVRKLGDDTANPA